MRKLIKPSEKEEITGSKFPDKPVNVKMIELRPEVLAFAVAMELKLRKKDHKGGWVHNKTNSLWHGFHKEVNEFDEALIMGVSIVDIQNEAVDVANFAMMIVDNLKQKGK